MLSLSIPLGLLFLIASALALTPSSSLSINQQPEAPSAPRSHHRPLDWGSLNFIHTTDVHVFLLPILVNVRGGWKDTLKSHRTPQTGGMYTPLSSI
jgi:2',3'-cyclic-nucleotide 2'-phosphodiesterase (5'-nucleotidase family)